VGAGGCDAPGYPTVWMDREFPDCPFERYADDIIAHCDSEERARVLWAAIAERLGALGLELHPVKTKIVCAPRAQEGEVVM
jgi:retron-type reverse transcriptase